MYLYKMLPDTTFVFLVISLEKQTFVHYLIFSRCFKSSRSILTGRVSDYEMSQLSAMRRTIIEPIPEKPPGAKFKNIFIVFHVTVLLAFGVTAIVYLNL